MNELIEQLKGLGHGGPIGVTLIGLVCLGAALKKFRWPPNNAIPLLLMLVGAPVYAFLAKTVDVDYTSTAIMSNLIFGGVLGFASVGAHQLLKTTLPFLFPKNGDTEFSTKDPQAPDKVP